MAQAAELKNHVVNVLRLGNGDEVYAFDGNGKEYRCQLITKGRNCAIEVGEQVNFVSADPQLQIHVALGNMPRNRLDWAVEKLTEAGASSLTLLTSFGTARCDRSQDVSDRWRRVASAASCQSGRCSVPEIFGAVELKGWLAQIPECGKILLSLEDEVEQLSQLAPKLINNSQLALIVGRVSGLDQQEEAACVKAGFRQASMGCRVLRAETAGIVAISVLFAAAGEI